MLRFFVLIVILSVGALLPVSARAGLVCEANIASSLNFGNISVRDGRREQTSGPVTISCFGGTPGTVVQACVTIGAGSGGAGPGQSPRYMISDGTASLQYQLTAQNGASSGGVTWDMVEHTITLNADGSAMIAPTLYAEVTSIGALATAGTYSSRFEAGSDVQFSYGENGCDHSGGASAFTVGAVVTTSCAVDVSSMDFGIIDTAIADPVHNTASINVSCTNGSAYNIGIGSGLQPANAGPTGRRMANGANLLAYGLYHDRSRTSDWGDSPATIAAGTGTGGDQTLTVFGSIFGNQSASIGTYSDTVVVTVSY
jgi:spore coat protein U-like protein